MYLIDSLCTAPSAPLRDKWQILSLLTPMGGMSITADSQTKYCILSDRQSRRKSLFFQTCLCHGGTFPRALPLKISRVTASEMYWKRYSIFSETQINIFKSSVKVDASKWKYKSFIHLCSIHGPLSSVARGGEEDPNAGHGKRGKNEL